MKKTEAFLELVAVLLGLVLLNILAGMFVIRWDLTEDKRYTLAAASQNILEDLPAPILVEVYLEGELNADFTRLQRTIREKLEEFADVSDGQVQFQFRNPTEMAKEGEQRNRFFRQLAQLGIPATQVTREEAGKVIQEFVFPGAVLRYGNKEKGVLLLKGNQAASPEEKLNQSLENVEYELITAIQELSSPQKPIVGFVQHFETLRPIDTYSLRQSLGKKYILESVQLGEKSLENLDALILAQPKARLTEAARYRLDQYIMNGGKVLFFVDPVQMNLDSIATGGAYAFGRDLNLEDMLFRYGIRLNIDLVQDQLLKGYIPINTGNFGQQANLQPLPWVYYPILNKFAEHPITRNLNAVYARFVSSLDTVPAGAVQKKPLLFTSQYSRIKKCPTLVDINEIRQLGQRPEVFNRAFVPVAYLLEGEFRSLYDGRYPPRQFDRSTYLNKSVPTRILVCSDGDLPRNEINPRSGQPLPLGFDLIMQEQFSNQEFIENALAYLIDPEGVISSRSQVVKMRPLDKQRILEEKTYWQGLNLVLPVLFLGGLGGVLLWWRKRKYGGR